MILLIGGSARCGKSTLMRQASSSIEGQIISLDNLRTALVPVASASDREGLVVAPKVNEYTPKEWLKILRRRDRILWKATKAFIEAAVNHKDAVIMEGCMWPDYVTELAPTAGYRAVFLIDTSPAQAERLIRIARSKSTRNNWMNQWSESYLRQWADYNIERSRMIRRLGSDHGQPVFDIADDSIASAQARALKYLLS